ncbi:NDP-sugar synthase [Parabacteroides sp. FAFU027]|uniref:nucleotidyltransferase family protein n=1 Tax=Parabacteroides sp. FAFU027 TaxID=2922715 RepID=UPI001FAF8C2F|nr:nucleotidyltransferase [Parabacteroides sp. FAFU027]
MKPTLFVLAAGMGSRYGGLKQMDGLGPNGETIMDYSIYDAVRAGFGKIVFVIRHSFEDDFRNKIINKYTDVVPVELVFQELDYLPAGFTLNPERAKPWGTNHAVLMGKDAIKEPFAVINADDFYGRESFAILADALKGLNGKKNEYCMIGYRVGNTLSESGAVARGVCAVDADDNLTTVVERTHIERIDGEVKYKDENDQFVAIADNTPVSMNMWGFTPDYFDYSESFFKEFLKQNADNIKAEFFIPLVVNDLINSNTIKLKVLDTPSKWFGVTYAADRPEVVAKINALIEAGEYPAKLW